MTIISGCPGTPCTSLFQPSHLGLPPLNPCPQIGNRWGAWSISCERPRPIDQNRANDWRDAAGTGQNLEAIGVATKERKGAPTDVGTTGRGLPVTPLLHRWAFGMQAHVIWRALRGEQLELGAFPPPLTIRIPLWPTNFQVVGIDGICRLCRIRAALGSRDETGELS